MSSIDRRPHRLIGQKLLSMPRHLVFFDTETRQIKQDDGSIEQRFRLGWAVYWRRPYGRHKEVVDWFYYDNVSQFWEWLYSKTGQKTKIWVIARNVVFDFTVCKGWEHLGHEGYKLNFFHNNGISAIVVVKKKSSTLVFLDSMNWFTESLAKTGERISIPKIKINFDTCTTQELSAYCKNDVLIELENFRIFIKFLQDNMVGRLCYTKASTAMAAYLFRHYHTPIWIHNNAEGIAMEREAYKGGRCECFVIGDLSGQPFYIVDVNSLYPYVMYKHKFPHKWHKISHRPSVKKLGKMLDNHAVVARVRIETDEPVYAIKTGRTIFPVGTFDTTLCSPELQHAIDHNHVVKVYDVVEYEQANIFSSYVSTMYGLRNDFKVTGNKEYEQIVKCLLNSLYGKFGQKAEDWIRIGKAPGEPDREEMILHKPPRRPTRLRYLLGEVFELKRYAEAFNSFPAIAAHVTAYARVYLWELMQVCGKGNYVYCDTDSLMVTDVGLDNLSSYMSSTELGKLKLERTVESLVIRGLKDYSADEKVVIKGIRKNAHHIGNGVYTQEQWPSFKGIFKTANANRYVVKNVTKHLTREYTKGNVGSDGIVTPFVL